MALQKTNLFCTKQNNIANTTFDLPKYTCNNSVKTKITFRKILAVQTLVNQPFDLATLQHFRNLLHSDLMCLQTTKQTVQINYSKFTRNPQTQHQPVSTQTIQFEPNFHDTTISVTCIIHQHDQLVEYKAVKQLHC